MIDSETTAWSHDILSLTLATLRRNIERQRSPLRSLMFLIEHNFE